MPISIHAPTRGATGKEFKKVLADAIFQSTLLQEERLKDNIYLMTMHGISIHAPTRGATFYQLL